MSQFKRAERKSVPLKLALMGVSGSGKTYSAIRLAHGLTGGNPDKILVVDTENESAALYSELNGGFLHEVIRPPFTPRKYVDIIRQASKEGIFVVVLDSVTHAWEYILTYKEELDRKGGNGYANWGKAKPLFRELKEAILQSPVFVIACLRAKSEYAIEESEQGGNRKAQVKKLGTSAITEPGFEFEFSVVWNLDRDTNIASVEKDRTNLFQGRSFTITEDTGAKILEWLGVEAGTELESGEEWKRIESGESEEFQRAQDEAESVKNGGQGNGNGRKYSASALWLRDVVKVSPQSLEVFQQACAELKLEWQAEAERLSTLFPEAPTFDDLLKVVGKPALAPDSPKEKAPPKSKGEPKPEAPTEEPNVVHAGAKWLQEIGFNTTELRGFKARCEEHKVDWKEEALRISAKVDPVAKYADIVGLIGHGKPESQEALNV